jgi:hypothetical protein
MKGILKNTKGSWFVWYDKPVDEVATAYDSLPLHIKSTEGWSIIEREDFFKKMVDKPIEYEIVNETVRGEFSSMGGGYTHYQVQFAKPIKPKFDWEYWKNRCLAAEHFIDESPCDPDIYQKQMEAYNEWQKWVEDER